MSSNFISQEIRELRISQTHKAPNNIELGNLLDMYNFFLSEGNYLNALILCNQVIEMYNVLGNTSMLSKKYHEKAKILFKLDSPDFVVIDALETSFINDSTNIEALKNLIYLLNRQNNKINLEKRIKYLKILEKSGEIYDNLEFYISVLVSYEKLFAISLDLELLKEYSKYSIALIDVIEKRFIQLKSEIEDIDSLDKYLENFIKESKKLINLTNLYEIEIEKFTNDLSLVSYYDYHKKKIEFSGNMFEELIKLEGLIKEKFSRESDRLIILETSRKIDSLKFSFKYQHSESVLKLFQYLFNNSMFDRIINLYDEYYSKLPKYLFVKDFSKKIYHIIGKSYFKMHEYHKSIKFYEKAINLSKDDEDNDLLFDCAKAYNIICRYDASEKIIIKIILNSGKSESVTKLLTNTLGNLYLGKIKSEGKLPEILNEFLSPEEYKLLFSRIALKLYMDQEFEIASLIVDKALQIDQSYMDAKRIKFKIMAKKFGISFKNYECEEFKEKFEDSNFEFSYSNLMYLKGMCLFVGRRYKESIEYFSISMKDNDNYIRSFFIMSIASILSEESVDKINIPKDFIHILEFLNTVIDSLYHEDQKIFEYIDYIAGTITIKEFEEYIHELYKSMFHFNEEIVDLETVTPLMHEGDSSVELQGSNCDNVDIT